MSIREESLKKHYEWKGKIEVIARCPVRTREDLALAYTPGVAEACRKMDAELLCAKADILARYRENWITLGKDISLLRGDSVRHGHALDIDESGALVVRYEDGTIEAVNSGEVSVRGMYGYL